MSLIVDVDGALLKTMTRDLLKLKGKIVVTAARQAINGTVKSTNTFASEQIRLVRKMKKSDLRRFMLLQKARGSTLSHLKGSIGFSSRRVSMLNFIQGSRKAPRPQGKVKRRVPLTYEITPGKKGKLRHAFIAKGRNGVNQVFQRKGKNRHPLARRALPSIARLVEAFELRNKIERFAQKKLVSEFAEKLKFNLQKLK